MSSQRYDPTDGGISDSQPIPPVANEPANPLDNGPMPVTREGNQAGTAPESDPSGVAHQAASLARDQVSEGLGRAAGGVERVANLADRAGQNLRQHDQDALAQYATRAAD